MKFRTAVFSDLEEMKQLYADTIQCVCNSDYNEEEREEWSSSVNQTDRWNEMIKKQYVLIAEINSQIAGFAALKDENYIDFFYVHKDFQRMGIAQELLNKIQDRASGSGTEVLTSDISITAKPFFEKNGFAAEARQENIRGNLVLVNYKMKKNLVRKA